VTKQKLLSDPAVKAKNKPAGYYLDGHGLYLQVSISGSKSWILRYTLNKKTREMGLGSVDDFALSEARERARQYRQVIADGSDPIRHRHAVKTNLLAAQAEAARKSHTFADCAKEYHDHNADDWKNAKHAAQWINTLSTYAFPKFGDFPVGEVTREHIRTALLPIWKSKAETASRVLQRIRTVINYGAAMAYCQGLDSEEWDQLKKALPKNSKQREVEHHASCPHGQVGAVLRTVRKGKSTEMVKLAFEFIVCTAARTGEVRYAVWEEIDCQNRCWVIPKERMKANRQHTVPLSDAAWTVLEAARQHRSDDAEATGLIFSNPRGGELSDMTFTQLLRRMGVVYTMHGFRASFRTWGADIAHYEHDMLEIALSHVVGDSTVRAYHRSDMLEKRRRLMREWAEYFEATAGAELVLSQTILDAMELNRASLKAKRERIVGLGKVGRRTGPVPVARP
jgi:integrase